MARPIVLRFVGDTSHLTRTFNATAAQSAALSGKIGALNTRLGDASQKMISTGAILSQRFTLPIAFATIASANLATEFEATMTKIETLAGESRAQVQAWTDDVLELARVLPQSPAELAEGLFFIASSGIKAENAMDILKASAKSSAVGMGETKVVADALTSAINAYGIENLSASRAADILIAAVREGKGEAEDFAGSIGRTIAPAQLLGVSFDQVAAAMSAMTLVGLSADESATALRQVFFTLAKPSAQVRKGLKEVGLSADEVRKSIRERGLLTTLIDLREKVAGNDELLAQIFPNIRAFNGLTIMTGENVGNTARLFDIMANSSGILDEAFKRVTETNAFKFEQAMNRLRLVGIDIGAEVLPQLVKSVAGVTEAFLKGWQSLSPATQGLIINIALVVAAIGPLLRIFGNLLAVINLIALNPIVAIVIALAAAFFIAYQKIEPFRRVVDAIGRFIRDNLMDILITLGTTLAGIFLPALGPIIGVAGALFTLYRNFEPVRNIVDGVARLLLGAFRDAIEWIRNFVPTAWGAMKRAADAALKAGQDAINAVIRGFNNAREAVKPVVEWLQKWVAPAISEVFGLIGDVVGKFVADFVNAVQLVIDIASPIIEVLIDVFFGLSTAVADVIGSFIIPALHGFIDGVWELRVIVENVFNVIVAVIKGFWNVAGPIISVIGHTIKTVFTGTFNVVKTVIEGFLQTFTGIIQIIRGIINGDWNKIWEGVKNVFSGTWHSIAGSVREGVDAIVGFIRGLPSRLGNLLSSIAESGLEIGSKFIEGIIKGVKGIASAAFRIGRGFTEALVEALKAGWNRIVDWLNDRTNAIDFTIGTGPFKTTIGLPDNMWRGLRLADGGIFNTPVFAQIAEAGEEAVIPLTRPARAARIMQEAGLLPPAGQSGRADNGPRVVVNQHITALDPFEAARRADADWQWAMKTSGV